MSKPDRKEYNFDNNEIYDYSFDLEEFCKKLIKDSEYTTRELSKYICALDHACEIIEDMEKDSCYYCPTGGTLCVDPEQGKIRSGKCRKECWKYYLLNGEVQQD